MNRKPLVRSALRALLLSCVLAPFAGAAAQNSLEILPLRHRTAEQVLPALHPLLEPGATLTGQGNQLIVRTSAANLDDLKRALDAIDRPLRRLQISVRFDDAGASSRQGMVLRGRAGPAGSGVDIRGFDQRSSQVERVDQRVQVLEGGRAFIMAGQSTPEPYVIRERATGFDAIPRLSGDTVFVDIAPQSETAGRRQYISTTASARLGEWFEVGGVSSSALGGSASSRVWLKIEELR